MVGRTDADNDFLTFRVARPEDWWFHVRGMPGSHTLLQGPSGVEPDRATLTRAAAEDAYYLRIRGMGPWLPVIDPRFYRRTLFAGLDVAPAVLETSVLMVADQTQPEPTLGGMTWTWLEAVALECVPPYRGLAVVSHADIRRVPHAGIACYQPIAGQLRSERDEMETQQERLALTSTTSPEPTRLDPVVRMRAGSARDACASLTLT